MQYRSFGKLDWQVSALGFGCMRLPILDAQQPSPNIDEPEAIRMIRHAVDQGVNYIDSAYVYHVGRSEVVLGKALAGGYRERVRVATKLPLWEFNGPDDFDRILDEQLERLQTGYIDFYLFHALNRGLWHDVVLRHNLLAKAEAALASGKIRHLGFSFHDDYEAFEEIVNGTDLWNFCQIQLNYMDIENQAGVRGLRLAAGKGLAVVIMEPLLGGRLADPPTSIRAEIDAFPVRRTPAALALNWLWNLSEVSVVLSGMTTMPQVVENLQSASASRIGVLTAADETLIASVREKYRARTAIPCTKCSYCMPCPNGVDIPINFEIYNHVFLYDALHDAQVRYKIFLSDTTRSSSCIDCGVCSEVCPQHIHISEWMPKITALLAEPS
jgi:predicted aldo/keto reductase-like oxidoreductase